ncbi:MAG TPA: DUF2330 domain-containing protein [Polyangiaceae bacterium]|jgi:hypothetical protein
MRLHVLLGAMGLGLVSMAMTADDARACGGTFEGPSQDGDLITQHRMIFSVSPEQTTLYDEIEYQGNPASFAWVLPIHGQVQVGLSSDVVFSALDSATQTTIQSPSLPPCASCSCGDLAGTAAADAGASFGGSSSGGGGGVNVVSQQVVGPYDTVQLQSTDPTALSTWLQANGFVIPAAVQPVIAAYVSDGFDFLALKLQPGQGVQAMRPVSVTTSGAGLSLPLRMVAAGTGPTVSITLWVVAQGRYEAANFTNFTVDPSSLVWDFNAETSNYTSVVQQKEAAASFAAWQTESSLDLSPYEIESPVLAGDADNDYEAVPASDAGGEGGSGETAEEVRQNDLATLFPGSDQGTVRITRLRADLNQAALANDLTLQASSDQSDLSNFYQVTQSVNAPACPAVPDPCPPCDNGGSSGSSGGGGGGSSKAASPGQQSFGCSAVPSDAGGGGWFELTLAGLLGLAIVRSRTSRKR